LFKKGRSARKSNGLLFTRPRLVSDRRRFELTHSRMARRRAKFKPQRGFAEEDGPPPPPLRHTFSGSAAAQSR